jgi:hypothetical protein
MSALDRLIPGQHVLDPMMRAPHEAAEVTEMLDTAITPRRRGGSKPGQISDIPNPPGYGLLGPQVPYWLLELSGPVHILERPRDLPAVVAHPWHGGGITAQHAQQTQCCHGHLFDAGNTSWKQGRYGLERRCRTCHAHQERARVARQREEQERPWR